MRTIIIGAILACLALIGVGVYFALQENNGGPRLMPLDPAYTQRVQKGYWAEGQDNAPVILAEYGDFQCPGCDAMFPIIAQAVSDNKDFVQFQFRNFPLINLHNKAKQGAEAAESAGRQGQFWQMHDKLYITQQTWTDQTTFQFTSTLEQYAKDLGLNIEQFKKDMRDNSVDDQIDIDVKAGTDLGIQGTPSLYINGKFVNSLPQSADALTSLLKAAKNAPQ